MSIISVSNLSFAYDSTQVLKNLSFSIEKGSYTAIVGSNGSGKSTLCRLLCGLLKNQSGQIEIDSESRVGLVFQSPKDQLVSTIVYRDTAFGPQNLKLPKSEIELRCIECLNVTGILHKAKKSTSSISLGQTQKVALSGILAINPDILILDEAVSMLDIEARQSIFEFLRYWHKRGNTIIHITHDMEAIKEADEILGLDKGEIFYKGSKSAFFENEELVQKVAGPKLTVSSKTKVEFTEPVLSFKDVNFSYSKNDEKSSVRNIDFTLYKGTVTALTGPSGAGKSTILELAAGLLLPQEGSLISGKSKPVLAFQNCANSLFEGFAADDVAFGPKNQGLKGKALKERVSSSMEKVNLPLSEFGEKHPQNLSGGQQRRLAIAGILAMDSDIMLFDEPSAGLDGNSRHEIMELMRSLAAEGKTVLFSTHQKDEAMFADREIRIEDGEVVFDSFEAENLSVENQLEALEPYENTKLLETIRKTGSSLSGENRKNKSVMEKLPGFLRIILFALIFISTLVLRTPLLCGLITLGCIVYGKLCGLSLKKLFKSFLFVLPFLLFFSIFQIIFQPALENEIHLTEWKWFMVTPSKLYFCLCSILRTFSAMAVISGFFVSTSEFELVDGLKILLYPLELIHIPVRYFILIVEIIFKFIPLLIDEAYSIMKTQIMRGGLGKIKGKMAKVRSIIPLFVPLTIQTIRRSEALADALTMRCFK